jgi:hypothetical protein
MPPVLQDWVCELTFMQQSVLITGCRGPDGLHKEHPAKDMCRWMRRCFLISAFDGCVLTDPYDERGGSFTGPCRAKDGAGRGSISMAFDNYMKSVDGVPHHFQVHLMHSAEILGYKHPDPRIREWWNTAYRRMVKELHCNPETEEQMDYRLGDRREQWLEGEAQ